LRTHEAAAVTVVPRADGAIVRNLRGFSAAGYDRGRSRAIQALWFAFQHLVFFRWWCPAGIRPVILRAFGATVGSRVLIRHRVRVMWPWKLTIGDDVWIGEDAWLLNLEPISIGSNVCVSQGAMLCTGSHDPNSATMEYDNAPITLGDGCWVAARATVLRGVTVGAGALVGATALVVRDVAPGVRVVAPAAESCP
jgi:putative colanic acid biosynthesis acetyltransferase WcaF